MCMQMCMNLCPSCTPLVSDRCPQAPLRQPRPDIRSPESRGFASVFALPGSWGSVCCIYVCVSQQGIVMVSVLGLLPLWILVAVFLLPSVCWPPFLLRSSVSRAAHLCPETCSGAEHCTLVPSPALKTMFLCERNGCFQISTRTPIKFEIPS